MKGLRLVRLIATVLVGSLALLAAVVALLLAMDFSAYRGPLEARLSAALGRHVVLGGEIRVSLSPLPTVTATHVAITNPAWAQEPQLATAERLAVRLRLLPLLRGEMRIAQVSLTGGELHLETSAAGTGNWFPTRGAAAAGGPLGAPGAFPGTSSLPVLEARRVKLTFRDGRSGVQTRLDVAWARASAPATEPFQLAFDGTLRGRRITAGVRGGPLAQLLDADAAWPVSIALESGGSRLTAEGDLRRLPTPRFDLRVHATGAQFSALGPLLGGPLPALGPFQVDARLIRDAGGYQVQDVRGYLGRPEAHLRIEVRDGRIAAPFAAPLTVTAGGRYRGEPFELTIEAAPYAQLLEREQPWPGSVSLRLLRTRLALEGSLLPSGQDFTASVQAFGDDIASLAPIVGQALPHLGPYSLQGRLERRGDVWSLRQFIAHAGSSDLRGEGRLSLAASRPRLVGRLDSSSLSLDDLTPVLVALEGLTSGRKPPADAPLPLVERTLPVAWLRALDAELELSVERLRDAGAAVEALQAHLRVAGGTLDADVAQVRLAGETLAGRVGLRPTNGPPLGELEARGHRIAYGPVLAALGLTNRLHGRAERLTFTLRGSGTNLREIWSTSVLGLAVEGGTLTYGEPETATDGPAGSAAGGTAVRTADAVQRGPVRVEQGQATLGHESGLVLDARGRYRDRPYTVRLDGSGLNDFFDAATPWRIRAVGTYAESQLGVEGQLLDPLQGLGIALQVQAAGPDLEPLGRLFGVDLPALGPYSLVSAVKDTPTGLAAQGIQLRLGQSDLSGEMAVAFTADGPRIRARLRSETLRVADLHPPDPEAHPALVVAGTGRVIPQLVYPVAALRRAQLKLTYEAKRLRWGPFNLDQVALTGSLEGGRLVLGPVSGRLWGGSLSGSLSLDASAPVPRTRLTLAVKDVEYTRALTAPAPEPSGIDQGRISFKAHLEGAGAGLRESAAAADGRVDFLGGTGRIDNRLLDLWAADLFLAALPVLGEHRTTPVKCLLGRFQVTGGQAETKSLLADLDRIVVKGAGRIDLRDETLDLLIWPEPRDRSLLRVTTPLKITGTLAAPNVSPQTRGVVEEVAWLLVGATNPLVLLLSLIHPGTPDQQPCGVVTPVPALTGGSEAGTVTGSPHSSPTGTITGSPSGAGPGLPPPPENEPPTPLSKAWEFLKGVGRMVTSPFEGN